MALPRVWAARYLDGHTPVRHDARVTIGASGLEIVLVQSGRTLRWPLAGVRQTQGVHEGEQVRLERRAHPDALLVDDVGFVAALRAASPDGARVFRAPARRSLVAAVGVLAALATVAVAATLYVWGIPRAADVVAARVPVGWEVALGQAAMAELAPDDRQCRDPERQRRIDDITAALLRTVPEPRYAFRVIVVDHGLVNAFAAPGGFIVVFRGLLEQTESAEELAGVLAHEIQHVLHRDATRAILRQASTALLLTALVGDVSGVVAAGARTARTLGDLHYSRDAERAADRDGLAMLHAAAIDPAGMLAFFRKMERLEGTHPAVARYLSSHPASAERLQALAAAARTGGQPPVKLLPGHDWADVTRICGRAGSPGAPAPAAPASR